MKFWESAVLAALLFFGIFGPIFLMMAGVEPFPRVKKEPASPPPPPIVVEVSCEAPQGWVTFTAEKQKVRVSPYRSAGWRIETTSGKRVTATNCFMQQEEAR